MSIFFPDVSNHNRGLVIQPGTSFVWAKASEGTYLTDNTYQGFKDQAASVGAGFGAYHFLVAGNGAAQADYCFDIVGPDVPLFVDVEPIPPNSYPTVADVEAFTARYKARGGLCEAMYYPKWYWTNQGSPDLSVTGLQLISSGYPAGYSDTDANWHAYGGLTPFQWQFSDSYEYGGMRIDFNAYKGSVEQYLVALGAETAPVSTPIPVEDDEDMSTTSINGRAGLPWPAGSRHVVEVNYAAANLPDLVLNVELKLTTGPEYPGTWTIDHTLGTGVYEIPAANIANCRGIILTEASGSGVVYDATAA
jgi:hypothetical protein